VESFNIRSNDAVDLGNGDQGVTLVGSKIVLMGLHVKRQRLVATWKQTWQGSRPLGQDQTR
jgi:hypothetical protein